VAPGTSLGPEVKGAIIVSGRDGIRALDAATGKERWRFSRPVNETNKNDKALGGFQSPAILDGECLYAADYVPSPKQKDAVGPSTFYCLGPEDGKPRWSTTIPTGTIGPSLAQNRDTVIVVREYGASAVDKATRRVRWSIDFNSTRAPAALAADAAYLPTHGLRAVSLKDGRTIWERRGAPAAFGPTLQDGVLYAPLPLPNTPQPTSRSTRRAGGSYGSGSFRTRYGRQPCRRQHPPRLWAPAPSSLSTSTTGHPRPWSGRDA
jgi:hypothetical protein